LIKKSCEIVLRDFLFNKTDIYSVILSSFAETFFRFLGFPF